MTEYTVTEMEVGCACRENKEQQTDQAVHREATKEVLFVGWLLNVPATCQCISGTDLLRQVYVLPH